MALDWTLGLLIVCGAFALGWLASRLDIQHWRIEARHKPKAYFKGLNFLMNDQQDEAVEAFIQAVQNDPDTAELHFTLGQLFRQRGEYNRAVRVHEHLLARADLSQVDRQRARLALAQDYWRAGLMDRAQTVLDGLQTPVALQLLLRVYERTRQWQLADALLQRWPDSIVAAASVRLLRAHYLCEQGMFDDAIALAPTAPRAYLAKAQISPPEQTYGLLKTTLQHAPQVAPLVAQSWLDSATTPEHKREATLELKRLYDVTAHLAVLQALVSHGQLGAQEAYRQHLQQTPSLLAASHLIDDPTVQPALSKATATLSRYRCQSCGFETQQYFWQCPGCQSWDSYPYHCVEEQ